MNTQNQQMVNDLLRSGRAIRLLNSHGITVHSVVAGDRHPKLLIENPVAPFLVGQVTKRVVMQGKQFCTYGAQVFGCQVEWLEITPMIQQAVCHA